MPTPVVRTVAVIDDDRTRSDGSGQSAGLWRVGNTRVRICAGFFADGYSDLVCVITDLGMRPVDGIQVLDRTVHSDAATPVIIITGKPSEHTEDYYLQRGAIGFFRKPVDGDALLDLLDSIA
jgi:FixJ family two-component response regulator